MDNREIMIKTYEVGTLPLFTLAVALKDALQKD
jgi:hypothetical protein